MDAAWERLRDEFLTAQLREASVPEIWRLIVADPWYQGELRRLARRALRRRHAPSHWQEDVRHEAMLLLAEKLSRVPDLHINGELADRHFGGWLSRITLRDCCLAVSKLLRRPRHVPPVRSPISLDVVLDVRWALRRISDPLCRTVLALFASGMELNDIAARLDVSYARTRRSFRAGAQEMRRLLQSTSDDLSPGVEVSRTT